MFLSVSRVPGVPFFLAVFSGTPRAFWFPRPSTWPNDLLLRPACLLFYEPVFYPAGLFVHRTVVVNVACSSRVAFASLSMWKLVFCCGGRCGNVASHFRHGVGWMDAREASPTRCSGVSGSKNAFSLKTSNFNHFGAEFRYFFLLDGMAEMWPMSTCKNTGKKPPETLVFERKPVVSVLIVR